MATTDISGGPSVRRAWDEHRRWSIVADRLKAGIDHARRASLTLAIVAAVAAVLASQVAGHVDWLGRALSFTAAIAAGLSAGVLRQRTGIDAIQAWTRARSASEGLKSEVFKRLAGSTDYDVAEPDAVLDGATREILRNVSDLASHAIGVEGDGAAPPEVTDMDSYVRLRLDDQIDDYYRPKAAEKKRLADRLRVLRDMLGVIGVVLGAVAAVFDLSDVAAWVPVVTTISTAVVAHVSATRLDYLIIEYSRTADELQHLRDTQRRVLPAPAFVDACERAISIENQAWMARWSKTDGEGGA